MSIQSVADIVSIISRSQQTGDKIYCAKNGDVKAANFMNRFTTWLGGIGQSKAWKEDREMKINRAVIESLRSAIIRESNIANSSASPIGGNLAQMFSVTHEFGIIPHAERLRELLSEHLSAGTPHQGEMAMNRAATYERPVSSSFGNATYNEISDFETNRGQAAAATYERPVSSSFGNATYSEISAVETNRGQGAAATYERPISSAFINQTYSDGAGEATGRLVRKAASYERPLQNSSTVADYAELANVGGRGSSAASSSPSGLAPHLQGAVFKDGKHWFYRVDKNSPESVKETLAFVKAQERAFGLKADAAMAAVGIRTVAGGLTPILTEDLIDAYEDKLRESGARIGGSSTVFTQSNLPNVQVFERWNSDNSDSPIHDAIGRTEFAGDPAKTHRLRLDMDNHLSNVARDNIITTSDDRMTVLNLMSSFIADWRQKQAA